MVTHVLNITETLDVSAPIGEAVGKALVRTFEADIDISESVVRTFHKNVQERFLVHDTLLRNTNGVVHDLFIRAVPFNVADFDIHADSPPVGYRPFQPYYPGDYEYREGIIGVRLTGASNGGQAGILGLTHNVDVPDITDRGQATVTPVDMADNNGEHTVFFSKTFTAPPEVSIVWAYGAVAAIPEIISVTETQFVFILRDIGSPSTKVEGTTTWAAIGR